MASRTKARVVRLPRPRAKAPSRPRVDLLAYGRTVVAAEARAISAVNLDESFAEAVRWILDCKGRVVVTGMGKPGFVA
jgi:arabinose-5-phosphate isomerase